MTELIDDSFFHYGVKGMRWGVRKDYKTQRRERKAQMFEAKAKNAQKWIDTGQYNNKKLTKIRDRALKDAEATRSGKLTTGQKRVLVGAAVVASLVAANALHNTIDSGNARVLINKGRDFIEKTDKYTSLKRDESLADKSLSADALFLKNVFPVNQGYGEPGTVNNCRRATFAYEMRRRGFDVVATKTSTGRGQDAAGLDRALGRKGDSLRKTVIKDILASGGENVDLNKITNRALGDVPVSFAAKDSGRSKAIYDTIAKMPNGSRGELGVKWGVGGSHSMVWEVVNGKPVVFDAQSKKMFKSPESLSKLIEYGSDGNTIESLLGSAKVSNAAITRLDNIELDEDFVKRWVKNG